MKDTTKKGIIQKIIISIFTLLIIFNFIAPTISRAEDGDLKDEVFSIVQSAVVAIGDGIMWIANGIATGNWKDAEPTAVYVKKDESVWQAAFKSNILGFHYVEYPLFKVTPEKIFANEIPLLNINIINASEGDGTIVGELRKTVSSWYQAFRNLVIVAMLSVLVYVAIRIILSSTAADKAKYKTMIKDWLIGFALIFFMHYIIAFSISAVELLTKTIKDSTDRETEGSSFVLLAPEGENCDADGNPSSFTWTRKLIQDNYTMERNHGGNGKATSNILVDSNDRVKFDDFMSFIRWNASAGDTAPATYGERFAYSVLYFLFIFYTVAFLYKYLKRVVTTIFLVIISPFVAFSYSLDKAKDGNAQGFSTWLKEFIFNLLIQPMHLLLYYVLVGAAMDLAKEHLIYVAIVLGFLLPAEKILREMFGFDKAKSVSSAFGGAMAGAGVMGALNSVKSMARALPGGNKSGGGSGGGKDKDSGAGGQDKIRMTDRKSDNDYNPTDAFDKDEDREDNNEESNNNHNLDGNNNNNLDEQNEDNPLPDQDYQDYYDNQNSDFEDQQSLDDQMRNIEDEDPNYTSNPEWMELNRQKEEQEAAANAPREQETPEEEEESEKQEEPKIPISQTKPGKFIRGVGRGIGAVARNHNITAGRVIKGVAKGAVKGGLRLTGAAAGLTIGAAAGLASDDYSNVLKYGAAGIVGGNVIGGSAGKFVTNTAAKVDDLRKGTQENFRVIGDSVDRTMLSKEDYQAKINKKADKEWSKSKTVKAKYADAFIGEDYKQVMADAQKYREAGITDDDLIISAMKADVPGDKKLGRTDKKRIAAANLSQYVSNEKDIENMGARLRDDKVKEKDVAQAQELMRQIKKTTYKKRGRR